MKKSLAILLMVLVLLTVPVTALAGAKGPDIDRLKSAGWTCDVIGGEPHCFDYGDGKSRNSASVNVMVFDAEDNFEGTEVLWIVGKAPYGVLAERPCPQSELLDLGFAFACHHYSH